VIPGRLSKETCESIGGSDMIMRLTSTVTSIFIALLFLTQAHAVEWTRVVGLDSPGVDNSIGLVKRAVVVGLVAVPAKRKRGEASENQKTAREQQSPLFCRRFPRIFCHTPFLSVKNGVMSSKIRSHHNRHPTSRLDILS